MSSIFNALYGEKYGIVIYNNKKTNLSEVQSKTLVAEHYTTECDRAAKVQQLIFSIVTFNSICTITEIVLCLIIMDTTTREVKSTIDKINN